MRQSSVASAWSASRSSTTVTCTRISDMRSSGNSRVMILRNSRRRSRCSCSISVFRSSCSCVFCRFSDKFRKDSASRERSTRSKRNIETPAVAPDVSCTPSKYDGPATASTKVASGVKMTSIVAKTCASLRAQSKHCLRLKGHLHLVSFDESEWIVENVLVNMKSLRPPSLSLSSTAWSADVERSLNLTSFSKLPNEDVDFAS
mmetsp:Transcript_46509/g.141170  ORF Transcript_46509/g.141170 Transcript_46509/m.141170 type:complete len:203 (+) Transcript_46509:40-648(+)